ncbi:MAG: hypothetical protein HN337_09840 [Deltaproteobacteria bacterium]|nr:hypothetical protein [Deltaproteobacteria bacterium]
MKKPNPGKAAALEAKGDKLLAKGKPKRALKKFKKALQMDPGRTAIYDKLMKTRDILPDDWEMEDFVESVDWLMKKQEIEEPAIKQIHAKLSPEWEEAKKLVWSIMASNEERAKMLTEELVKMGEIGTRAAINTILEFKQATEQAPYDEDAPLEE